MRPPIVRTLALGLSLLLLAACGGNGEQAQPDGDAPTTGPTAAETDAPEAAGEPVTIRFAEFEAEGSTRANIHREWAERLAERSDGRIDVEFFWAQSLVTLPDMAGSVGGGLADGGTVSWAFDPRMAPLANIVDIPGTVPNMECGMPAAMDYFQTFEPVKEQFAEQNLVLLYPYIHPGETYLGSNVPIQGTDDLSGLTVRGLGGLWADLLSQLGLETVTIAAGELYTALERGTVDGAVTWTLGFSDYRWYEQVDYLTSIGVSSTAVIGPVLNKTFLESLSAQDQELIMEVSAEMVEETIRQNTADHDTAHETMADAGVEILTEAPGDLSEETNRIAEELREPWLDGLEAEGMPAREAFETFQALLDEHCG